MSEVVDGYGEGDEQVSPGVTDHRKTRRRNIREWPKWKGTRDRRLHFECCPTPYRLARHNQAGDNPDRHEALAMREPADLFDPSSDESQSMKAQNEDAIRQRGTPCAE